MIYTLNPPIIFQDHALPVFANFLDVAANNQILSELDEETSIWFWRFTICKGRTREVASECVKKHARILIQALCDHQLSLKDELPNRFPGVDPSSIIDEWKTSLTIMLMEANKVPTCQWTKK